MPFPRFTIRTLILFTSVFACFGALNRIPSPEHALCNFIFPLPEDQCFRQPYIIEFGIPLTACTNHHAVHLPHETGPCKFDSTYHPVGIIVNLLFAMIGSMFATAGFVLVARFAVWQIQLARERAMIDVALADPSSDVN
ncbi:hypothetical protein Pla52n_70350 [Stieleria varia]|uniref:Transmembrane protein n=1 Tax=Stieleria varia TaxID=2528005 RepID=A0A5C5ZIN3_9BACT|nr:hypothetical protein Pla52n_70350 [Stieleria varia]